METSRPGIYHCGVFHAPMDIPDSVTMASGAASLSSQLLNERRGTLVEKKEYPVERDVRGEPPRVGVFVCDCGTNIVKTVDVKRVVDYARGLMGVVHAEENTFSCSIDSVTHMANVIRERVSIASWLQRAHQEPMNLFFRMPFARRVSTLISLNSPTSGSSAPSFT
jgi:heterodisulfide reductase subunit A2